MGRAPRVLLAAAYALGVLLVAVPRVLAHGVPVSTSPAANAILERSPPQIEIFLARRWKPGTAALRCWMAPARSYRAQLRAWIPPTRRG